MLLLKAETLADFPPDDYEAVLSGKLPQFRIYSLFLLISKWKKIVLDSFFCPFNNLRKFQRIAFIIAHEQRNHSLDTH